MFQALFMCYSRKKGENIMYTILAAIIYILFYFATYLLELLPASNFIFNMMYFAGHCFLFTKGTDIYFALSDKNIISTIIGLVLFGLWARIFVIMIILNKVFWSIICLINLLYTTFIVFIHIQNRRNK